MGLRRVSNAVPMSVQKRLHLLHSANFLSLRVAKCVKWYNGINSLVSIISMSTEFSTVCADSSLEECVSALGAVLRERGMTVSCAESCTGGGIAYAFTSVSGSSDWFHQSWVTYSNDAKQAMLGVKGDTLEQFGAVSEQTVTEMVQGVVANSGASAGISVSGIAGPGGGSAEKPVGTVWFGFKVNGVLFTEKQLFSGDRTTVREKAIRFAVNTLYQRLVAE